MAAENACKSVIDILSSSLVFFDYNTLTAFPINNIFSANALDIYPYEGSILTLRVYRLFHCFSSSSRPKAFFNLITPNVAFTLVTLIVERLYDVLFISSFGFLVDV